MMYLIDMINGQGIHHVYQTNHYVQNAITAATREIQLINILVPVFIMPIKQIIPFKMR